MFADWACFCVQDDTTFEKQSSLFALAVADVLLINMWCHDIGREHAANKPLLKIVFQASATYFCILEKLPGFLEIVFISFCFLFKRPGDVAAN